MESKVQKRKTLYYTSCFGQIVFINEPTYMKTFSLMQFETYVYIKQSHVGFLVLLVKQNPLNWLFRNIFQIFKYTNNNSGRINTATNIAFFILRNNR